MVFEFMVKRHHDNVAELVRECVIETLRAVEDFSGELDVAGGGFGGSGRSFLGADEGAAGGGAELGGPDYGEAAERGEEGGYATISEARVEEGKEVEGGGFAGFEEGTAGGEVGGGREGVGARGFWWGRG